LERRNIIMASEFDIVPVQYVGAEKPHAFKIFKGRQLIATAPAEELANMVVEGLEARAREELHGTAQEAITKLFSDRGGPVLTK
jgi:hypothetical protein